MSLTILQGDALEKLRELPDESVQCCVTSPPYWGLRDYGADGQIGLEPTPNEFVAKLVDVFSELRRVLRKDGTLWLNLGDSYATGAGGVGACPGGGKQGENWKLRGKMTPPNRLPIAGLKPKDLIGIPWRVAFALQADGWYLRSDIIWSKPNPMPESVTDRPTKAHEYLFLLSKSERYYYDHDAIKEPAIDTGRVNGRDGRDEPDGARPPGTNPRTLARLDYSQTGRNKRSVWTVPTHPYPEAHFATYPPDLIKPCILAGTKPGDTVLDTFGGSGTTGMVAIELGRQAILIEINPAYAALSEKRCNVTPGLHL